MNTKPFLRQDMWINTVARRSRVGHGALNPKIQVRFLAGQKKNEEGKMNKYHKIWTVYKRDESTHKLLEGVYSLPEFEYLALNDWMFTEKVDGTNIRVIWYGECIGYHGKTDNAQMPLFLREKLTHTFSLVVENGKMLELFGNEATVCLYGEGYGARIQKGGGKYISDGVDFVLFDVKIADWWLRRQSVEDVADKLNLRVVPMVGIGTLPEMVELGREGFKSNWGDFQAEGLVAKPMVEMFSRKGDRIITKVKYKDFYRA